MAAMKLSGNQYINTVDEQRAYRIVGGYALVFLLPVSASKPRRRMFLGRVGDGFVVPSLNSVLTQNGDSSRWQLLILPDEEVMFEQIDCLNSHRQDFARAIGLNRAGRPLDGKSFADILIREYLARESISEERVNLRRENRAAFEDKSINALRADFAGDREHSDAEKADSGEVLYDAVSFLCSLRKLKPATLDTVHTSCGRDYDVHDLARLSGFVCREIELEQGWQRREFEPMLCFMGEERSPVVCYPKGKKRTRCWDAAQKRFFTMDWENLESLAAHAFVFYRPLSGNAVTLREITLYAMREFSFHDVSVMLLATFFTTFISLQFSRLSENLYDVIIPQGSFSLIYGYGALMASYMFGGLCAGIAKGIAGFRLNSRIKYALQTAIYDRLFHLPESFFRRHENADLAYRAGMLADSYVNFFNNVSQILMMLLFSGIYMQKMYSYSAPLSNIGLGFIAANIAVSVVMGYLLNTVQRKKASLNGSLRSFLFQAFSGINSIRSSGAEDSAVYEYMKKYVRMSTLDNKSSQRQRMSNSLSSLISALATVTMYSFVSSGGRWLSVGSFMGFTSAYSALSTSMLQVSSCVLSVFIMLPMLKNSMEILRLPPERADVGYIHPQLKGDIRIADLSFAYGKSDKMTLSNINLHIRPGEYVALVGPSGCGKSTLLRLLLGFEKPLRGKIYYDGVDLERVNKPELRRKMGVVLQDGVLFSGSIYRNIRIARPTATEQDVLEAVRTVALEEDISDMPLGLQTLVSEQAQTISGGQKQRILLARAVIGKPSVLMLDEATSALDNITQAKVCENLAGLGCTRITVAHRLSTVKDCDRIIVLDAGRIVEEGSFAQLMEKKGAFWQLTRSQSL